MTQKLFAHANDKCAPESPDNPMNQEILLGGHVYLLVLKVSTVLFHLDITSIPTVFMTLGMAHFFGNSIDSMWKCFFTRNNQFGHSTIVRKIFRPKRFQTIL